ncbi:protein kinase family protein [Bacillus pumilus]|uniref:protein kinase family protein n=1 Tax=Bacillus pumilus TaxID=1408 RepID=UPI00203A6EA9|nr:protein kinase family protein [Bacillus pumilus]MCM3035436.1 protein kinase family protein [Bacillus pumilus]
MSEVKRLAESIQYHEDKRLHKLAFKPAELELCGKGRSAYVFSYKKDGKKMALKVFFPSYQHIARKEAAIYEKLSGSSYYPEIYESGDQYILMEYIKGNTFYECLTKGIPIKQQMIEQVDDALEEARKKGLNPSDIHLRNLILTKEGQVRVIDVARFTQTKACHQWDDLKAAYAYYQKPFFPKKAPRLWLEVIAYFYKKNWLSHGQLNNRNDFSA